MDQLHLIRVFVAVLDTNGFAGAARKLGISPPAVTRAISELEQHLGVQLLIRTTRVVRVTEAGARYGDDCRRLLADLVEADQQASGAHGSPHGRLTITAPVIFGGRFVIPVVTEYLQSYPEVTIACWFVDRVVNMMDEGIDVAVRIGDLPDSSTQAIRVGTVRRVICASPGYLEQYGIPQSPEDLAAHTIISASAVTPTSEWKMVDDLESRVVSLQPRITTTSNDSAVVAAASGFGLTRLLSYQVADKLREGKLQTVLNEFESAALPVHLLHREGRHVSPKARAFLDLATERLRDDASLN